MFDAIEEERLISQKKKKRTLLNHQLHREKKFCKQEILNLNF